MSKGRGTRKAGLREGGVKTWVCLRGVLGGVEIRGENFCGFWREIKDVGEGERYWSLRLKMLVGVVEKAKPAIQYNFFFW